MSKTTVEQRVVEMRFDNRQFERGARESLSTLEKLKQKLNFKGASKGLEEINTTANKVDMKGMSNALDTVKTKFSAMEVIGVTALANITNSAVNAGKRLLSSLTIDNVASGWSKYEQKTGSVQTIMNATGKSIDEVNQYLEKLMWFSDETSYGFTDMTAGLATMVSSGGDIEKLIPLITGVANATAFAGKGAAEFSRVLQYGINQAYSLGYMQVQDWKTIEGATVNSKQLMETLIAAGEALGKIKKGQVDVGNFRMSLKDQWLDKEVMEAGFGKFAEFSEAVHKAVQDGTYETATEAIEAMADQYEELGVKAFTSAQEAKTFTEAVDATKDALGSAFMRIFESIFGNYEQAKKLWTDLAYKLYDIFVAPVVEFEERLKEALSYNPFTALMKKLENSGIGQFAKKIDKITNSLEDYQKMVNKIWRGDYNNRGDNPDRFDLLEKEGWNPHVLQTLVNKGYKYKITTEDITAAQKKHGVVVEETTQAIEELTDAQLKEIGLTEEEIEMYRDLEAQSKKTGKSISELIENMSKKDGRTLLIESFKNIGNSILRVFKAIGDAWKDAFPPMSSIRIYNLIEGFNKLTSKLVMSDDTLKDLTRTLKGVFAIVDLISMVVGGAFRVALTVLKTVLGMFNLDILEFTALIGDALVAFRNWVAENNIIIKGIKKLVEYIVIAVVAIKDWVLSNETIMNGLKKIKSSLSSAAGAVKKWFEGLKEAKNVPKYILEGLVNGLKKGASIAFDAMIQLGTGLLEAIKKVLGIHSPSTEFFEIGKNIMQGLFNGISSFVKMVYNLVMSIGGKIIEIIKNLDIGSIFTILTGAGMTFAFIKIAKAIDALTGPLEGLDYLFEQAGKTLKSFRGLLNTLKLRIMAETLKSFAVAIAILAGSIVVLTMVNQGKMWSAVGALVVLMGVLAGLTAVAGKAGGNKQALEFGKLALTILALGVAMAFMAKALKTIADIDSDSYLKALAGFVALIGGLYLLINVMGGNDLEFVKLGTTLLGMSVVLAMFALVGKSIAKMSWGDMGKAGVGLLAFLAFMSAFMFATQLINTLVDVDRIGATMLKISGALLIMAIVVKIIGKMDPMIMLKGISFMTLFGGMIVGLMAATKLIGNGNNVGKFGASILGIAAAMMIMVLTAKIAAGMNPEEFKKGTLAVTAFGGIVVGLMAATKLIGGEANAAKIGRTIFMVSLSIGVLGIVAALLGMINIQNLAKGIAAVGFLGAITAGLMAVTKMVPDKIMGTLIVLTVAIGVLALAVAGLSLIDPSRLGAAAASLGGIIAMFSLLVFVSSYATQAITGLLVMVGVVAAIGGMLYLLTKLPMENALSIASSLSMLLLSLSVATGILALVGLAGPAAFIGIAALATLVAGIGGLIVGIGALFNKFPMLEEFLNKGIPVLEKIGFALGSFVGHIVGGFASGVLSGLPAIGTSLSQFMNNAEEFIDGARNIDKNLVSNVASLAGAILILTATDFINSMTSWITGGNSIEEFGSQLVMLAYCINQFANNLGTFDDSRLRTVECASQAIKALANAASEIPNTGGLWAAIVGENGLSSFASELPIVGLYLNQFVTNLGTFTDAQVKTIECAGKAIKTLSDAASEIPNDGGLAAIFAGENSIDVFGSKLPGLGSNLNQFVTNLGTFTKEQVSTVDCAGKAILALSKAAAEVPNEGGVAAFFAGENDLTKFGEKLPGLATNITSFVKNLGTFSDPQVKTVNSACDALKAFAKLGEVDIKDTGKGLESFGKNMIKFAGKIKDFVTQMAEVNVTSMTSAINKVQDLIAMASSVVSLDSKVLSSFGDSLKNIAKKGVKGFIEEFTSKTTKADGEKAGEKLANSAIDGVKKKKDKFKDAGKDLVQGLINGLKDSKKRDDVYKAAFSLGELAVKGEKDGQKSKSPSKATEQAGKWLGEGLVIGIQKMGSRVYGAGKSMGEEATNSISSALNTAINLLNSDMDAQPTIRPVLDLSDIRSGAGYLNSMFNGQSIGVTSNLRAISLGMSSINQNGTTSDVVTAINKLRKDLGNVGGTTYNVNGVTYDDGSNITEAVRTIVRAAKVERRI